MKRKENQMNEYDDWFPEGQDSWGNSSIRHYESTSEELEIKTDEKYNKWLQMSENKRPLELTYIIRAIKEGKLNE
jgi:hypothetical protein